MSSEAPVPTPRTAVPYGITDPVERARAELKAALAAIEVKGNLPRRASDATERGVDRVRAYQRKNPAGVAAGVVAVAAGVGALVWWAVKAFTDD
ncbi:hypothetical protein [Microbacterium terricola]|uniref:DUF3618 domain-containing protein n=1 Tax=Microbacterium terricola TaxID=344163 RepID=A0ABM8E2X1_9MICO|nr:hypothetical protein [Microbacterium terricola]UYK40169.1 hypothetical protein OAU46_00530 [Microbacterium terricola]BDV32126.1 hypothetical protein Microterr_27860 [Microbacterium terricola]